MIGLFKVANCFTEVEDNDNSKDIQYTHGAASLERNSFLTVASSSLFYKHCYIFIQYIDNNQPFLFGNQSNSGHFVFEARVLDVVKKAQLIFNTPFIIQIIT